MTVVYSSRAFLFHLQVNRRGPQNYHWLRVSFFRRFREHGYIPRVSRMKKRERCAQSRERVFHRADYVQPALGKILPPRRHIFRRNNHADPKKRMLPFFLSSPTIKSRLESDRIPWNRCRFLARDSVRRRACDRTPSLHHSFVIPLYESWLKLPPADDISFHVESRRERSICLIGGESRNSDRLYRNANRKCGRQYPISIFIRIW